MTKISLSAFLSILLSTTLLHGGDEVRPPERREFRQRSTYPFVFEPVSYLANGGPKPLRFGEPIADCAHRDAPPLPKPAEKKEEPPSTGQTAHPDASTAATPAAENRIESKSSTAPPEHAPDGSAPVPLPADAPDFNKTPDEVLEYYKNPYNAPHPNRHLFDPIFEPAVMQKGERSKATYRSE